MLGVIRVFTSNNPKILTQHAFIITEKFGIPTKTACIPDQPKGIYNDETEAIAIPKIVEEGIKLVNDGCQAIFISCAADPALEQLRKSVQVPVFGAGSAAAYTALAFGKPVGAMGIGESVPPAVSSVLGDSLVDYIRPEGVTNTTDLLTPKGKEKGIEAAKKLIDKGAEVIVFACTGFSTIQLKDELEEKLGVIAIDAVEAGGRFAAMIDL